MPKGYKKTMKKSRRRSRKISKRRRTLNPKHGGGKGEMQILLKCRDVRKNPNKYSWPVKATCGLYNRYAKYPPMSKIFDDHTRTMREIATQTDTDDPKIDIMSTIGFPIHESKFIEYKSRLSTADGNSFKQSRSPTGSPVRSPVRSPVGNRVKSPKSLLVSPLISPESTMESPGRSPLGTILKSPIESLVKSPPKSHERKAAKRELPVTRSINSAKRKFSVKSPPKFLQPRWR